MNTARPLQMAMWCVILAFLAIYGNALHDVGAFTDSEVAALADALSLATMVVLAYGVNWVFEMVIEGGQEDTQYTNKSWLLVTVSVVGFVSMLVWSGVPATYGALSTAVLGIALGLSASSNALFQTPQWGEFEQWAEAKGAE